MDWITFMEKNRAEPMNTGHIIDDETFTRLVIEEKLKKGITEFRQPLQEQSHLEMPGILVHLGNTQRT